MSNFERDIPIFIKDLEAELLKLSSEKYALDWGHECDCEYCPHDQGIPDETEKKADNIDRKIRDLHLLKKRLIAHAKIHGVQLL